MDREFKPAMSAPSQTDRIAFWMHSYARASFIQARDYAQVIIDHDPPLRSTMRKALTDAIFGAYCRPFKQRPPVKLPQEIIPASHREFHDAIIKIRDKVVAHRDLNGPISERGFVNQLQLNFCAGRWEINTYSPTITNENSRKVVSLANTLIIAMDQKIEDFTRIYLRGFPSGSCCVVSLDESPEHWLIPNSNGDSTV